LDINIIEEGGENVSFLFNLLGDIYNIDDAIKARHQTIITIINKGGTIHENFD